MKLEMSSGRIIFKTNEKLRKKVSLSAIKKILGFQDTEIRLKRKVEDINRRN